jgi:4-hydroxybenzoate polyprenyltransferase
VNLSLKIEDFTWSFLGTIISWSVLFGLVVVIVAVFLDASVNFLLSFLLAAAIDVGSLWFMSREGHKRVEEGTPTTTYIGGMTAGRVLGKAFLLLLAALVPALDFLGVVVGVLLVDTTILVVGSIASAWKVMRDDETGWNAH